jgi:hypothetical protein
MSGARSGAGDAAEVALATAELDCHIGPSRAGGGGTVASEEGIKPQYGNNAESLSYHHTVILYFENSLYKTSKSKSRVPFYKQCQNTIISPYKYVRYRNIIL